MKGSSDAARRARFYPLGVLTFINLLNYIDRYLVTSLLPQLQQEIGLTDAEGGLLGTAFMVTYFVVSPVFGWLGDRFNRPRLLAAGVVVWSLATASTGLPTTLMGLFVARALVGVGEAAYGSVAPALITGWFEKAAHGRVLSIFYLATPVGGAMGYLLGGVLAVHLGWRQAFFWVGLPGVLAALLVFFLKDPESALRPVSKTSFSADLKKTYRALVKNRVYVGTVLGNCANTFALGGFAFWAPTYMMRVRGFSQDRGMLIFGAITVLTGVVGTLAGGFLGDALQKRHAKGYTWLSVVSMALGSSFCLLALTAKSDVSFISLLVCTQVCIFANAGPINALIVGLVDDGARATAMATSIFCIHLFGDAVSPYLLGLLSDRVGLAHAMLFVPAIFALAGLIWASLLPAGRSRTAA